MLTSNVVYVTHLCNMNVLSLEERTRVIAQLVEGTSIRATVRITGIAKKTVMRLLVDVGEASEGYCNRTLRNLKCRRLECDEIWSFVGSKASNTSPEKKLAGCGVGR